MSHWVARTLLAEDLSPAIALRGYHASRRSESDEATEHEQALANVPVAIGSDRISALRSLTLRGETFDCVVLDDGFQRRDVKRQLDIVLLDATRDPFRDAMLPAGLLREPVAALCRAGAIVVTRADRVSEAALRTIEQNIRVAAPQAIFASAAHRWTGVRVHDAGGDREEKTAWLSGKTVVACCAIGRPEAFFGQLRDAGATLTQTIALRDHASFSSRALRQLERAAAINKAHAIVCTEKDWMKLRHTAMAQCPPAPIARPCVAMQFLSGEQDLRAAVLAAVHIDAARASAQGEPAAM